MCKNFFYKKNLKKKKIIGADKMEVCFVIMSLDEKLTITLMNISSELCWWEPATIILTLGSDNGLFQD